ncbi:MAG: hypothetical protein JWM04_992 [Verrucomicrobiales bacterium]|nr:hypothetical protein [Verrucomicrobiales bacterium]
MKKIIFIVVLLTLIAGGLYYLKRRGAEPEKAAEEKPPEVQKITHDEHGRTVLHLEDEIQGNIGILVAKPAAGTLTPEAKGFGKVLDSSTFSGLMNELSGAHAASLASSNELVRLKTLVAQGNASERTLQSAEAAALKDQLAIQSAMDRFTQMWGSKLASFPDLVALSQSLSSQKSMLVRIDLPVGEHLNTEPAHARIFTLSEKEGEGDYVGSTTTADPSTLSRGYLFLVRTNTLGLVSGEPVTAYLQSKSEPITGAVVLRESVVRAEGFAWVYVLNAGGESFTRTSIPLEHPIAEGWFITTGVSTNDNVVIEGAQTLLSEEQKGAIKAD